MAINKDRIVQIINSRAVPANQPLPPSMPGYDKDYKGYAYDPAKAKELLAEAGHPRRLRDRAVRHATPTPTRASPRRSSRTWRRSASRPSIQSLAQANVIAAGGEKARRADDLVGRHGAGSPTSPIRRTSTGRSSAAAAPCRAAGTGPGTATRSSTSQGGRGRRHGRSRRRPKSACELWRDIFVEIMDDAPWAPVFNEQRFTMKSPRMGGDDNSSSTRCTSRSTTTTSTPTMCSDCDHTIHGRAPSFRLGQRQSPRPERWRPATRSSSRPSTPRAASSRRTHARRCGGARLRQGQPGHRPGLRRRGRARRRAEGHAPAFEPSGWGWTANIPGFGLLADQFPEPALHIWKYDPSRPRPLYGPGGRVPLKPFAGTIGLAPAEPGLHSIVPPRRVRRQHGHPRPRRRHRALSAGRGARARCSRSATPMPRRATARSAARRSRARWRSTLQLRPRKGRQAADPRFTTPGPVTRHLDAKGYEVTTGIGPDLMTGARDAVCGHDRPARRRASACGPVEAYMLCSVCADLRISEIVDMPNWVVSFYFPRLVLAVSGALAGPPPPLLVLDLDGLRSPSAPKAGRARVVEDVSFAIGAGEERLGLVGESGCGKSVTALAIMRLLPAPPGRSRRPAHPVRRPRPAAPAASGDARHPRRPHRHDLPGADDRAQPGAAPSASRSPRCCGCTAA